jgi:hypothetical protein
MIIFINLVMLFILALVLVYIYVLLKDDSKKEHFTTEESEYDARVETIKIFDLVVNRKPTPEEIDKYSAFQNEQDILQNVLKDFKDDRAESDRDNKQNEDDPKKEETFQSMDVVQIKAAIEKNVDQIYNLLKNIIELKNKIV